jgi:hypoxanthine phosphoribosyltransferase
VKKKMEPIVKQYITPDELRRDSYTLAAKIVRDGFRPTFLVALWRGGAPVGCYVHEFLKWKGITTDHIAIRTSRYTGIDQTESEVVVHSTSYLREKFKVGDSILLIDDVWDSGVTIAAFFNKLECTFPCNLGEVDIRVATVYYKPHRNRVPLAPSYYIHESKAWLVFPHELEGMTVEEVERVMGSEIAGLLK